MDGQSVFSSGYEWGYWLNDVVAARAAWDVHLRLEMSALALKNLLEDVFKPFGAQRAALVDALLYWMDVQHPDADPRRGRWPTPGRYRET